MTEKTIKITQSCDLSKLKLILALSSAIITTSANNVLAQNITIDGTLSPVQTLNGPDYTIPQSVGQTVGSNLFHSLGQFSLIEGESATFQSNANIRNIFSRVTGGFPSNIDGLIFTQSGNVNLYLINPSGIVFGPNARLDVGGSSRGSFIATTADALVWSNGSQFSATNPGGTSSLLTIVGDPSGFLFNHRPPQPITVSGSQLSVYEGQSLLLLGGDVNLDNSFLFVDFIEGGRIELGAVAEPGTVGLTTNGDILSFSFPDNLARADVTLTNQAEVNVIAGNAGSIDINARNINILEGSGLRAGLISIFGDVNNQAGDITLNATGAIRINESSFIQNVLAPNSTGNAGNINIITDSLALTNGARLNLSTFGTGNAGSIIVQAREVSFDDSAVRIAVGSSTFNAIGIRAEGTGGNISISTDLLSLTNGAQLITSTFAQGNAGNVIINAEQVRLDSTNSNGNRVTTVFTDVDQEAVGNGGNISINTGSLFLTNGARLVTSTFGQGNAGNVTINAQQVRFDGVSSRNSDFISGAFSTVEQPAVGDGGNVRITTNSLSVINGAQLSASTFGQGNAGNIQITASEVVNISGTDSINRFSSGLFTFTTSNSTGKGGDITVNSNLFRLSDGAVLNARTRNNDSGGDITVNANFFEALNGGQLLSTTSGRGSAGTITVNATERAIISGSDATFNNRVVRFGGNVANVDAASGLFVRSDGLGSAGDIEVNSPFVLLDNGGRFIAESRSVNGGDISVNAGNALLLRRGSQISTTAGTAQAGGNGGNININAGFVIALPNENSNITANAFSGTGGQVQINTQGIFGIEPRLNDSINSSDITASSTTGINGEIIINTPNVDPTQGLTNLPADTVNTASLVDSGCAAFDDKTGSQFNVTGRGGLPASPDDVLSGDAVWSDTRLTVAAKPQNGLVSRVTTPQKSSNTISIVPATGWVFNNQGEVTLVSQVAKANTYSVDSNHVACVKP